MQRKHAPNLASRVDELLPVGQASALVGVSTDTLKRWERAGRIRAERTPTGHRRFRRSEVERLLRSGSDGEADA